MGRSPESSAAQVNLILNSHIRAVGTVLETRDPFLIEDLFVSICSHELAYEELAPPGLGVVACTDELVRRERELLHDYNDFKRLWLRGSDDGDDIVRMCGRLNAIGNLPATMLGMDELLGVKQEINAGQELSTDWGLGVQVYGGTFSAAYAEWFYGELLTKANKTPRTRAEVANDQGFELAQRGLHVQAVPCHLEAIGLSIPYVLAWVNLGIAYRHVGEPEKSLKCYDGAIGMRPNFMKAWYNKAVLLASFGQLEHSLDMCKEALRLDPFNELSVTLRGRLEDALRR